MSECWGDSRLDRDGLDWYLTRERSLPPDWDLDEVVARCLICQAEIVEGEPHLHRLTGCDQGYQLVVQLDVSGGTFIFGENNDLTDTVVPDNPLTKEGQS